MTHNISTSIIEGTKEALERLQLDYVDVIFAHRPDPTGMSISVKHKVLEPEEPFVQFRWSRLSARSTS